MKNNIILELKNIFFTVNNNSILKGINLTIEKNHIHGLLGQNGTGKSTLGALIMGLNGYTNHTGDIVFKEKNINDLSISDRAKTGISIALQIPPAFEGISVREYLNIGRKNKELSIDRALKMVGLDPQIYLNRTVDDNLSGGERKRIELASLLMVKPDFAILDEPDSGIDFLSINDIIKYIKFLNSSGVTILLITHREEIAEIADRTSLICNGIILKTGDPQSINKYFMRKCAGCNHKNNPDETDLMEI